MSSSSISFVLYLVTCPGGTHCILKTWLVCSLDFRHIFEHQLQWGFMMSYWHSDDSFTTRVYSTHVWAMSDPFMKQLSHWVLLLAETPVCRAVPHISLPNHNWLSTDKWQQKKVSISWSPHTQYLWIDPRPKGIQLQYSDIKTESF